MPKSKKEKPEKPQRRSRGEGTVVQRDDGRYVARIPLGGGKRKEEYYDTKQEAERAKRRMLNERDAGNLTVERDQTFKEYLLYWLKTHRLEIRETTYSSQYAYVTTRVIPALGHVKLKKLKVEMFQELYQKWLDELSPNTIRLLHAIICKALNDAVEWKKLTYNPVQYVKLPKERKTKIHVLSDEEIVRLLQYAREMRLYPLFRMALLLGMRLGELSGLRWSDINFETSTLQVRCTVYYLPDPDTGHHRFYEGPPKTEAGERLLHLPKDIIQLLHEYREQQEQMKISHPYQKDLDLIFCTSTGNYITPINIEKWFSKLLQKTGIEHMKFHGLRHNASLILRKLGIDPVVRKEMLGHTSMDMTDGIYGHTTPKMHQEAAQEIDCLLDERGI
jgi:integrase